MGVTPRVTLGVILLCTTPLGSITPHPPGSDFAGHATDHATEGASSVRERVKGVRFS